MAVQVPTPEQVKVAATEVGLSLTAEDIQSYIELMKPNVHAYNLVDAMSDYLPVVRYPRTPGSFPPPEENTHNAWYVKTTITVPCGMINGLPVGLMLIGKHFDEPTIYRAAYAFEQAGDWKAM